MSISDMNAERKWRQLPKDFRERLLSNVFCSNCYETTIVDYSIKDEEHGILLQGKCQTCGQNVARFVEDV